MKTVATTAVEAINEQNRNNAQANAVILIKDIVNLQNQIDANETDVEALQAQLAKLAKSEITMASVTGTSATVAQTETQKTIAKAIEAIVNSKQGCVAQRATTLGEQIVHKKASNETLEKEIVKKQEELGKIEVEVIVEADVLS